VVGGRPEHVLELRALAITIAGRTLMDDVAFNIEAGECCALVGPSGVGKTSLLNCIAGITAPTGGSVIVTGTETSALNPRERARFRLRRLGLVFQFGELLPELTARDNVALPSRLMGVSREEADARADRWLDRLDVTPRAGSHPGSLSGGEIQRVGIARALAHEPALVLADEPTGMLDEQNTDLVTRLLFDAARGSGTAVLLATHDPRVAATADQVLTLHGGRLHEGQPALG